MNHVLLWENIVDGLTPTVSPGTAAGYPVTNLYDWRAAAPYTWRSSATTKGALPWSIAGDTGQYLAWDLGAGVTGVVDAIAIGGHNLYTAGATFRLYGSPDNATANAVIVATAPASNVPIMVPSSVATAYRYWCLTITTAAGSFSAAPMIGVLTFGRTLVFSEGCQPGFDPYGEEAVTDWFTNDNGHLTGSNFRYRKKSFKFNFGEMGLSVADFWRKSGDVDAEDWVVHARTKPFWFCWNLDADATGETYLCRAKGRIGQPFASTTLRRNMQAEFEASTP